jgi:hypothetical protein
MGPLDTQLQRLKERHQDATWEDKGGLGLFVTIPNFILPAGWNKSVVQVKFLVPQGFPYSQPDCFWADGDLRVQGRSEMPQATQNNAMVPEMAGWVWFSWHLAQWNPNRDDLLSWMACIRDRFLRVV